MTKSEKTNIATKPVDYLDTNIGMLFEPKRKFYQQKQVKTLKTDTEVRKVESQILRRSGPTTKEHWASLEV